MATNRYKNTEIVRDTNGKRYYKTTIFPTIEEKDTDIYLYTRRGDRLDLLADRYYGDSTLWWIIAEVNHLVKGSLFVEPNLRIRIPTDIASVIENLKEVNNSR